MLTRVHHVGLVVRRLEEGLAFWGDVLGLQVSKQATVQDQGVRAALLPIGRSEIELLEPINPEGGVAKFLEKRGEGLHHVCFETPNVADELAAARARGLPLIDETPRPGLAGMICFLHPKGTRGVLVEFATPPAADRHQEPAGGGPLAGLALREITVRTREAHSACNLFVAELGLTNVPAAARPGITVAAAAAGGVRLAFVAADPGSASGEATAVRAQVEAAGEGLAGLILEVNDLGAAVRHLQPHRVAASATGCALDPARCHGVPLDIVER